MRKAGTTGFLAMALWACLGAAVFASEIEPFDVVLDLDPGEIAELVCTVPIPCDTSPPKADIYIVADTTRSMNDILEAVAATADELVATLLGTPGVDVRIGVGNYRDFPEEISGFAFDHQLSLTDDASAIEAALSSWSWAEGGDKNEGQFYALTKIVRDPTIGFREGADVKRIIVWFGDAPSHDPICEAIHGDPSIPFDMTEDLLEAGATGTTVIAISTRAEFAGALDYDPTVPDFVANYDGICEIGGFEGQASRLTSATGGIHIEELPSPEEITPVILEAVDEVLRRVDVTCDVRGEIEDFVVDVEPEGYFDVQVPVCPDEDLVLEFVVTLEGRHCLENKSVFEGAIDTLVDEELFETKSVQIRQPLCEEAVCFLVIGAKMAEIPLSDDPRDVLLLKPKRPKNEWILPVTMESIPTFPIPQDPRFEGKHVYMQVYMNNPIDFPGDPVKVSNGLDITLGNQGLPVPYGPDNEMDLWAVTPAAFGGELVLQFSIDDL